MFKSVKSPEAVDMTINHTCTMNKDRRTYEPQDMDDVRENPYGCPKTDRYERELARADYLRDEMKDREWEAAMSEESLMPRRDALWAKHDGLTPALAAEMLVLAGELERELAEVRAQLREEQHLHTATLNERDRLAEALDGISVACFRIGRGDVGDICFTISTMRQKALAALAAVKGEKP